MTTKDAILALAAKIAGTTQDNVSTTAQALTKLAYAATGQAPTTDLMTVDDCIAFITANYTPGGGGTVEDIYLWNYNTDTLNEMRPSSVFYISGYADGNFVNTNLEFEDAQTTYSSGGVDTTIYGVRVKAVPAGAALGIGFDGEYSAEIYYNYVSAHTEKMDWYLAMTPLLPIDGFYGDGYYTVIYDG